MTDYRHIGVGTQSIWGTTTLNLPTFLNYLKETFKSDRGLNIEGTAGYQERLLYSVGKYKCAGSVDMATVPDEIGIFLHMLFGKPTSTGVVTGAWSHEFKPKVQAPFYTMAFGKDTLEKCYNAVVAKKWNLKLLPAMPVYSTFDLVARNDEIIDQNTPAYTTYPQSLHGVGWATTIGAAVKPRAMEYNFEVDLDLENYERESQFISEPHRGAFTTKGTMDLNFDSLTELKRFYDGVVANDPGDALTPFNITTAITGALITGTTYYKLTITTPKVLYHTENANVDRSAKIIQNLAFEAVYDTTQASAVKVDLVNRISAYYLP